MLSINVNPTSPPLTRLVALGCGMSIFQVLYIDVVWIRPARAIPRNAGLKTGTVFIFMVLNCVVLLAATYFASKSSRGAKYATE